MVMAMAWSSSLSTKRLLFISAASILLLFPTLSWAQGNLEYHNGPILSGNLDISILWYGRFGRPQKRVLRQFIQSLNDNTLNEPRVSTWWKMVEQYQSVAPGGNAKSISVRIVKEQPDKFYSVGKVLTEESVKALVQKATGGVSSTVALLFTDRDVAIEGTCKGRCSRHGFVGKILYMVVGNPETKCPNECGWPFNKPATGGAKPLILLPLQPPSGNVGTDSMVIGLAAGLAETVSNPFNTGLFGGSVASPIEAVSACPEIFGSGAIPGFMGKVRLIPGDGGCYNAHGVKGSKFLLPGLWNPKTRSCWTLI